MPALPVSLADFEVDYVHDHVGSAVQEDEVSTDQDVGAFWRGRCQAPLEFLGAGLNALLQTGWKCAAAHQLFFQSWRQLISLGESRRKMIPVIVIPAAHGFMVAISIEMFVIVACVPVFVAIVVISMFVVTLAMAVAMILG
jgi:hypothetical protein